MKKSKIFATKLTPKGGKVLYLDRYNIVSVVWANNKIITNLPKNVTGGKRKNFLFLYHQKHWSNEEETLS